MESQLNKAYNHLKRRQRNPKGTNAHCIVLHEKKLGAFDEQLQKYAMPEINTFVYGLKQ